MIPQRFITVLAFPMTSSGKVDLNSLRALFDEA
jgi:non-ribosomal peptide synthetase component E (peptide arylation enzyme)